MDSRSGEKSTFRRIVSASVALMIGVPVSLGVIGAAPASAATCPSPGTGTVADAAAPASAQVVFSGHGWGHGLGMSQYGAQGAARLGCGYKQILGTYYKNTKVVSQAISAPVQLAMLSKSSRSTVLAETGAVTWKAGVVQAKGQTWSVVRRGQDGKGGIALVDAAGQERIWVAEGAALSLPHSGTVIRVRSFLGSNTSASKDLRTRWDVARFVATPAGTTVRQDIVASSSVTAAQKYLWGLAEVPVSWPSEALKAQVVAARTYLASKYDASAKAYTLVTTTSDQVYSGYTRELQDSKGAWRKAVNATANQVVVDAKGTRITTMYSSSDGGYSEDRQYVYGSYGISYLKAVDDSRWDLASDNPRRSWAVGMSRAQVAKKLGLTSVSKVAIGGFGSTGRLAGLQVTGVKNGKPVSVSVSGSTARSKLGLPSPGFTVRMQSGTDGGGGGVVTTPPAASGQAISGDWDGDGFTDVGWYAGGVVYVRTHAGKTTKFAYGFTGATAVVGDWNGDGKDGIGVFKDGKWYLRNTLTSGKADTVFGYGRAGDIPVAGHWAGAGAGAGHGDGIGVVRGDTWLLRTSAAGGDAERWFSFGNAGQLPLVGDWDGDGIDDPGLRAGTTWIFGAESATSAGAQTGAQEKQRLTLGAASEHPLVGAWNGQKLDHPGIARTDGTFRWKDTFTTGDWTGGVTFTG